MIELWDEKPRNNWRDIRKARRGPKLITWKIKLLQGLVAMAIGAVIGWALARGF